jgi:hypothetical protein
MDPEIISGKVIDLVGNELNQIRTAFYDFVEQQGWEICGSGGGEGPNGEPSVDVSFFLNGRHYWVEIRLALAHGSRQ